MSLISLSVALNRYTFDLSYITSTDIQLGWVTYTRVAAARLAAAKLTYV
jgi:hypothetical protein